MNGPFDLGELTPTRYFFCIAVVLGLLFAFTTPSQARDWDLAINLVQWQMQSLGPMLLLILSHNALQRVAWLRRQNAWAVLALSGLVGTAIFAPAGLLIDIALKQETLDGRHLGLALLKEFSHIAPPVVLCWLAINAPWVLGFRLTKKTNTQVPQIHEPSDTPAFFDLVPEAKRGELIYLKSELHYLQVVTLAGQALILCNLKDAIAALPNNQGIMPHRSYWVSQKHIKQFKQRGRQGELILSNDERIPVSRNNVASFKQ